MRRMNGVILNLTGLRVSLIKPPLYRIGVIGGLTEIPREITKVMLSLTAISLHLTEITCRLNGVILRMNAVR
jgi:hypothetical protein